MSLSAGCCSEVDERQCSVRTTTQTQFLSPSGLVDGTSHAAKESGAAAANCEPQPPLRLPRFRRRPASKWAPARELALSWPFRTLRRYRNRGIRRISLYQPLGRFAERVAGSGRTSPPDYRASDGGHRRNCKRSHRLAGAGDQQCRRFQCNPQTSLFRIRTTTRARPYRSDVRIDWDTPLFRDILSDAGNDIWQQGF